MYTSAAFNLLINWGVEGGAYPEGTTVDNAVYRNDIGDGNANQFVDFTFVCGCPFSLVGRADPVYVGS